MTNQEIDEILSTYPEKVAEAKQDWQEALLEAKRIFSNTYLRFKAENADSRLSATDLKYMTQDQENVYKAELETIKKESTYTALYEKLMSAKKLATFREAY